MCDKCHAKDELGEEKNAAKADDIELIVVVKPLSSSVEVLQSLKLDRNLRDKKSRAENIR